MNNFKPLISILIPVHNSEKYLADCLKSLVSQSYRNIEIVAIEDKSTDSSYQILKKFNKNYKKIRAYRNVKRYGIVMTLNRLIKKAKRQYLAFMHSNDLPPKNTLHIQ